MKRLGAGAKPAGTLKVGADDVKFSATYGQVARYVGLAMAADAIQDAKGDIQGTNVLAAYLAYRHFWNNAWRSSLIYSIQQADYDDDTVAAGLNENAQKRAPEPDVLRHQRADHWLRTSHAQLEKSVAPRATSIAYSSAPNTLSKNLGRASRPSNLIST